MKRPTVCFSFLFALNMSGQQPAVPRVTYFSGVLQDRAGKPQTGTVGITFSLYEGAGRSGTLVGGSERAGG